MNFFPFMLVESFLVGSFRKLFFCILNSVCSNFYFIIPSHTSWYSLLNPW